MPHPALATFAALGLSLLIAAPAGAAKPAATKTPPAKSAPAKAPAETAPERLGGAQNWSAYYYVTKTGRVCYLAGRPTKSEPANLKRGDVDALVTHRPSEKSTNVVSFVAGYLFKEGSDAELEVDAQKFTLFTDKDTAWARDATTDKAVVEAMARGKNLVVKGTSTRGTTTADTYSLAGFSQTLSLIDKSCNVKR